MRTIKFRGKNCLGKWLVGDLLHNRGEVFIAPISIDNPLAAAGDFCIDPATVGQFTGLLDKNGVEIYEGDIVKGEAQAEYAEYSRISDVICSEMESSQFCFRSVVAGIDRKDMRHGIYLNWGGWVSMEVIGNIHDNPELLIEK